MVHALIDVLVEAGRLHSESKTWNHLAAGLWWRARQSVRDGYARWSEKTQGNIAYEKADGKVVNARFFVWMKYLYKVHTGLNPDEYAENTIQQMAEMFGRANDSLNAPPKLVLTDDAEMIRDAYTEVRSCMSSSSARHLLDLYFRNKRVFKALIAYKGTTPVGRAIVATATKPDGETVQVLDRAYVSENEHRKLFLDFAKQHGFYSRVEHTAVDYPTIVDTHGKEVALYDNSLVVQLDDPYGYYPYVDTWAYLYKLDGNYVLGARQPEGKRYAYLRYSEGYNFKGTW